MNEEELNEFLKQKEAFYKTCPTNLHRVVDEVVQIFADHDLSLEDGLLTLEKVKEVAAIIYGEEVK